MLSLYPTQDLLKKVLEVHVSFKQRYLSTSKSVKFQFLEKFGLYFHLTYTKKRLLLSILGLV